MASGKSTIAKKYRSFHDKMAWIKVDNFKELFDHFEKGARPVVHGTANAALDYLLKNGYSVVMEGVFQNVLFIDQAVQVAQKQQVPCKVFALEASLETLQKRDKVRVGVKEGCREPLTDEEMAHIFQNIQKNPYTSAIPLDTENLTVEAAMQFIDAQFVMI